MPHVFCRSCGRLAREATAPDSGQSCPQCGEDALLAVRLADPAGTSFFIQRVWDGARRNERPLSQRDVDMLLYDFSTDDTREEAALELTDAYLGLKERHPDLDIQDWINDMLEALNRSFEHDMVHGPPDLPGPDTDLEPAVQVPEADVDAARPWTQALAAIRVARSGDPFIHFLVENWFAYSYPRYMGTEEPPKPEDPELNEGFSEPPQQSERPGAGCLFNTLTITAAVLAVVAVATTVV